MGRTMGSGKDERLDAAMRAEGLDALVALSAENAEYLSGRASTLATLWRVPGLVAVAVGAAGALAVAAPDAEIGAYPAARFARFAHPVWIEHLDLRSAAGHDVRERIVQARPASLDRPPQYDPDALQSALVAAIGAVAAGAKRIGTELSILPATALVRLRAALPGAELVDATDLLFDLRAIKGADEIDRLRLAAELTERGIAAASRALRPGLSAVAVAAVYQEAIWRQAARDRRFGQLRQVEGLVTVGDGTDPATLVGPGQTVKLDMQVDVGGLHSDIGRTYAIAPTADQRAVYAALRDALQALTLAARPGIRFCDLWVTGSDVMRRAGFSTYSRGHLGHSVGLAHNYEEPPFVAAGEARTLQPGMILSLELPYYLAGLGSFQLERMVLITDGGHEPIDRLPFELEVVGD